MAKQSNKFDEFMESIPIEISLVDMLNKIVEDDSSKMSDFINESNSFPDDLGEFESKFHGQQYGDDASCHTVVWYSKKYDKHIETYYHYDSYNGDDYSDSTFREVKPEIRTYTHYAPLK